LSTENRTPWAQPRSLGHSPAAVDVLSNSPFPPLLVDHHTPFLLPLVLSLLKHSRYDRSMQAMLPAPRSGFDTPATYRIGIQGRIPERWRDRLEGMAITERSAPAETPVTTLSGELPDQASLVGVLNSLYELHLTVLSVERLATAQADQNRAPPQ
jgi:hypothetical protein